MKRRKQKDLVTMPRRARRARRGSDGRRGRFRRYGISLLVVLTLAAGGVALVRSPLFEVDGIEVSGMRMLSRNEVLAASGLRIGMNVLSVDTSGVRQRLERIPLVASAKVERIYPSQVKIQVTERKPSAVAIVGGTAWLIEARGALMTKVAAPPAGLPVVKVTAPPESYALSEALRLWVALPAWAKSKTSALTAPEPTLISALIGGTQVIFGSADDVLPKMQAVIAIFARAKTDRRRVSRIDVRAPHRPAAVFV